MKKKKYMYSVGDCEARELYIIREPYQADLIGEFCFETVQEAKDYCLERIDSDIELLLNARKEILNAKS